MEFIAILHAWNFESESWFAFKWSTVHSLAPKPLDCGRRTKTSSTDCIHMIWLEMADADSEGRYASPVRNELYRDTLMLMIMLSTERWE